MQITNHFERKDPENSMSEIIYRALDFETKLKPECVRKIAQKVIPAHASDIQIMGVFGKITQFRINLDDAQTSAFPRFMYEIMNWEGNTHHWNNG
jgi:hypothetical protein